MENTTLLTKYIAFINRSEGIDNQLQKMESIFENQTDNSTYPPGYLPSGYSKLHIAIASIVVVAIMLEIIFGNILVIIAIAKDRHLKTRQNWLIGSLSVADLCVGSLVMPLTLTYELMGYWPFGLILCEIWLSVDVMLCTASVMNLCMISLDRYFCITRALTYPQKRTPLRMAAMIATCWGLSAVICLPPLFGWKTPQPQGQYPHCNLSQEIGYILYSICGSFFIPLIITCGVYAKVLHVARKRARRTLQKKKVRYVSATIQETTVFQKESASSASASSSGHDRNENEKNNTEASEFINTCEQNKVSEALPMIEAEHNSTPELDEHASENNTYDNYSKIATNGQGDQTIRKRLSVPTNGTALTVSLKERIRGFWCLTCCALKAGNRARRISISDVPNPSEKQKRKIAKARERRATLTVGLIVASFALCWLPFSISYVIDSLFNLGFQKTRVFAIFFWLGYVNSGLNPLVYTVFNRDFRQAFKKILHIK